MQPYQHFTLLERECLSEKLKEGKSLRKIAKDMNRSPSTISREVKRNWSKKENRYHPWRATVIYICRRKVCVRRLRITDKTIYDFITQGLNKYWSPETISERWKMEHPNIPLSHATIYRALKKEKLFGFSRKTHLRRCGKRKNVHKTKVIHPVHTIHDRPEIVNQRGRLGDMEGDTVYGSINGGVVLTAVDRKSRMLYAALCKNRDSNLIQQAFQEAFGNTVISSLTLDNGSEFAKFTDIEKDLNTTIYFADPHSSWQRGSNENINDLLSFFYPKGTNFNYVSEDDFKMVVSLINNRPRKCLGWLSPIEFFSKKCCT